MVTCETAPDSHHREQRFHLDERPVRSIYFGGGTPTLISESNMAQIADCLRSNLSINSDAEFTIEAKPVTLTQRKADMMRELKVNRVNLGVQSLSDDIIKLSNRKDTEEKYYAPLKWRKVPVHQ